MAPKKRLFAQDKTAQEIVAKAKTIRDEGLDEIRRFIGHLDDVTLCRRRELIIHLLCRRVR